MRIGGWRSVLWILGILLLTGCQPRLDFTVLDTITDTEPACWLDICPGSTTRNEALNVLWRYEGITITSQDSTHPVNPSIRWSASPGAQRSGLTSGVMFTDVNDIVVTRISLDAGSGVRLRAIVSRFGLPPQDGAYEGGTEQMWMWLTLRYPNRGLVITHLDDGWQRHPSDTLRLKPQLRVHRMLLFASDRVETLHPPAIGSSSLYPYIEWPGWDAEIEVVDLRE